MEKLVCDRCGITYTDEESIKFAKLWEKRHIAICAEDGVEARGVAPCPILSCRGELCLEVIA